MLRHGVRDFQVLQDHGAVAVHLHHVLVVIVYSAQQSQSVVPSLTH